MSEPEAETSRLAAGPWRISVAALSRGANVGRIEAIEEERVEVARALEIIALEELALDWRLAPLSRGRWRLSGRLHARAVQACVVTLEPVAQEVDEEVAAIFVPDTGERGAAAPAGRVDGRRGETRGGGRGQGQGRQEAEREVVLDPDEEAIEPIVHGQIVLGGLAYEVLAVSLDPYPRAAGASWPSAIQDET